MASAVAEIISAADLEDEEMVAAELYEMANQQRAAGAAAGASRLARRGVARPCGVWSTSSTRGSTAVDSMAFLPEAVWTMYRLWMYLCILGCSSSSSWSRERRKGRQFCGLQSQCDCTEVRVFGLFSDALADMI